MEKIISILFFFTSFSVSFSFAQENENCFYKFSLYNWKWNYCYGEDTVSVFDLQGNYLRDTSILDTSYHPKDFILKYPIAHPFDSAFISVTSFDGKTSYIVKGFHISPFYKYDGGREMDCKGAYLTKEVTELFNSAKSGDEFIISKIEMVNPVSQSVINIPGIHFRCSK